MKDGSDTFCINVFVVLRWLGRLRGGSFWVRCFVHVFPGGGPRADPGHSAGLESPWCPPGRAGGDIWGRLGISA